MAQYAINAVIEHNDVFIKRNVINQLNCIT
jgi:hypothetical protein